MKTLACGATESFTSILPPHKYKHASDEGRTESWEGFPVLCIHRFFHCFPTDLLTQRVENVMKGHWDFWVSGCTRVTSS